MDIYKPIHYCPSRYLFMYLFCAAEIQILILVYAVSTDANNWSSQSSHPKVVFFGLFQKLFVDSFQ